MTGISRPVEVHLYAAARSAAGVKVIEASAGSLGDVLADATTQYPGLATVLERCSTLVDGVATADPQTTIAPGVRIDVLPPFAGG
ncbi:MAG: hypothetical protein B7C55_14360 [Actinomycetales bacterium mxb001]|nr:MAG: hypothetical protein B7C55_14360 [Actinomycetales bacterium mxb001]